MKTKEELIQIALSGNTNLPYKKSLGFNEADKFLKAFQITPNEGKYIPVRVVYYFYYKWVKEDKKTPKRFKTFCNEMGKYTKSVPWSYTRLGYYTRTFKLKNFPAYTVEDELQARRVIRVQKARKKKKNRRSNKTILQSPS